MVHLNTPSAYLLVIVSTILMVYLQLAFKPVLTDYLFAAMWTLAGIASCIVIYKDR